MDHKPNRRHRFAVIDIGSNSVRLVVYEGSGRFPQVLFNEKVLCGLGRGVGETGVLAEESQVMALRTLKRFSYLIDKMKVDEVRAVATAAMRDARNGAEFVERIHEHCKIPVEIISGNEEARFSGLGVLCGIPDAEGIVGDLGGSSLELVEVGQGQVFETVTMPVGPLRLMDHFNNNPAKARKIIENSLSALDWVQTGKGKSFFAVGGAWRALARVHMTQTKYPLHILHNYIIERDDMLSLCATVQKMDPKEIAALPGVPSKRADILPLAALIAEVVFTHIKPSRLVVSALGLREGLLFERMARPLKGQHPFIASCRDLADVSGRFPSHAKKLMSWIGNLFENETVIEKRLRFAVCILSDVGWRGHPDYRAEKVLLELLYGRYVGVDHRGCALVGLALYVCYGGSLGTGYAKMAEQMLSEDDIQHAKLIGLALRLGQRFSGGTSSGLKAARLHQTDSAIILTVQENRQEMAGEVVVRRLESLARALSKNAEIIIQPENAADEALSA